MKKIYKQPMSRIVSYGGEEELLLLPLSWRGSEDEGKLPIIEDDPNKDWDGKGVKENKSLWDEVW